MSVAIYQFIAVLPDAQGICSVESVTENDLRARVFNMIVEEFTGIKSLIKNSLADLDDELVAQWKSGQVTSELIEAVKEMHLDDWLEHMATHEYQTILFESLELKEKATT